MSEIFEEPFGPPTQPGGNRDWIGRVKQADAEAENAYAMAYDTTTAPLEAITLALIAIAAELRAQRIARRPGAGQ